MNELGAESFESVEGAWAGSMLTELNDMTYEPGSVLESTTTFELAEAIQEDLVSLIDHLADFLKENIQEFFAKSQGDSEGYTEQLTKPITGEGIALTDSPTLTIAEKSLKEFEIKPAAASEGANAQIEDSQSHTVVIGDSLWSIAAEYYGSGREWPRIYAANQELIGDDPSLIIDGTSLEIPPVDGEYEMPAITIKPAAAEVILHPEGAPAEAIVPGGAGTAADIEVTAIEGGVPDEAPEGVRPAGNAVVDDIVGVRPAEVAGGEHLGGMPIGGGLRTADAEDLDSVEIRVTGIEGGDPDGVLVGVSASVEPAQDIVAEQDAIGGVRVLTEGGEGAGDIYALNWGDVGDFLGDAWDGLSDIAESLVGIPGHLVEGIKAAGGLAEWLGKASWSLCKQAASGISNLGHEIWDVFPWSKGGEYEQVYIRGNDGNQYSVNMQLSGGPVARVNEIARRYPDGRSEIINRDDFLNRNGITSQFSNGARIINRDDIIGRDDCRWAMDIQYDDAGGVKITF